MNVVKSVVILYSLFSETCGCGELFGEIGFLREKLFFAFNSSKIIRIQDPTLF